MRFEDVGLRIISYKGDKNGVLGADEGVFIIKTNIPLGIYDIYCTNAINIGYTIQSNSKPSERIEEEGIYITECRARLNGGDSGIPVEKLKEGTVLYKITCLEESGFPVFFNLVNFLNEAEYFKGNIGRISDGYHTFDELYYYRMLYNAAFLNEYAKKYPEAVVKSKKHDNGELCFGGGWFVVQANLPTGQISNHYEEKYWDLFKIPESDRGFEFDGHNPEIAGKRLEDFLRL